MGAHPAAVDDMVERMDTASGKALYGSHKRAVDTTFDCVKEAMEFHQLTMGEGVAVRKPNGTRSARHGI